MLLKEPFAPVRRLTNTRTHHALIHTLTGHCLEFIDLTERVNTIARESRLRHGLVNLQTRHTTAALIINENEPLLIEDMRRLLETLAPRDRAYAHDDFSVRTENMTPDEQPNGHAHCKALFLRASETLNLVEGVLQLGRWQRIFLVELDRPRPRTVSVMVLGQ